MNGHQDHQDAPGREICPWSMESYREEGASADLWQFGGGGIMSQSISFFVPGIARPGGSKSAFPTKSGKIAMVDSSGAKGRQWRHDVGRHACDAINERSWTRSDSPLHVTMVFVRDRPKGHYGSGKNSGVLKSSAPRHPTGRPDVLKLARSVEDALTGLLWVDDAQIVLESLQKQYPGERFNSSGVFVVCSEMESSTQLPPS